MIKWTRTSRLSIKISLSLSTARTLRAASEAELAACKAEKERERKREKERERERGRGIGRKRGLCCGSRLRKGEVLAYVGRIHNLKDLKDNDRQRSMPGSNEALAGTRHASRCDRCCVLCIQVATGRAAALHAHSRFAQFPGERWNEARDRR